MTINKSNDIINDIYLNLEKYLDVFYKNYIDNVKYQLNLINNEIEYCFNQKLNKLNKLNQLCMLYLLYLFCICIYYTLQTVQHE